MVSAFWLVAAFIVLLLVSVPFAVWLLFRHQEPPSREWDDRPDVSNAPFHCPPDSLQGRTGVPGDKADHGTTTSPPVVPVVRRPGLEAK